MCVAKSPTAAPILSLALLPDPEATKCRGGSSCCGAGGGGAGSGCGGVWAAWMDISGTATVLFDQPGAAAHEAGGSRSSSSGGGSSPSCSSGAAPVFACSWQAYGDRPPPGPLSIWWGASSCSAAGGGASGGGLSSSLCFTAARGELAAWLLPQQAAGQPAQLARTQLPFPTCITVLAAAPLVLREEQRRRQQPHAALVAAGDTQGGVAVLLLLTSPSAAAAGSPAASPGRSRLVLLAAARRVHELTPVRFMRVALPDPGPGGSAGGGGAAVLARQLEGTELVTAGGDGCVHTLRLPEAAVAAALHAALAPVEGGGAEGNASCAAPPRLVSVRQRRYDAVTHIDGLIDSAACAGPVGGSSSRTSSGDGGDGGAGSLVYGSFGNHYTLWDDMAEAEAARVSKQRQGWASAHSACTRSSLRIRRVAALLLCIQHTSTQVQRLVCGTACRCSAAAGGARWPLTWRALMTWRCASKERGASGCTGTHVFSKRSQLFTLSGRP